MFERSQKRAFKPATYYSNRRKYRMPSSGLITFLIGIALGGGGLFFLQTNYAPPHLSLDQAAALRSELNTANLERQHLQSKLDAITPPAAENGAPAANDSAENKVTQTQAELDKQSKVLALLQDALPPAARGSNISTPAALFKSTAGQLDSRVFIVQTQQTDTPFEGSLTFTIQGRYPNGRVTTIRPDELPISVVRNEYTENTFTLPAGFTPTLVVLRVFDNMKKQQSLRTFYLPTSK